MHHLYRHASGHVTRLQIQTRRENAAWAESSWVQDNDPLYLSAQTQNAQLERAILSIEQGAILKHL